MNQPLEYRNPDRDETGPRRRSRPRHMLIVGFITCFAALLLLAPAWWIGAYYGRFIVAFAVAAFLFGGTLILNGVIDWFKEGRL